MADEPEVLEVIDVVEGDEPEAELIKTETEAVEHVADDEGEDFTIGDEAAPASTESESVALKAVREAHRNLAKENAKLRAMIKPVEVGPKPTIEGCEWDNDRFESEWESWTARKAEATKVETETQSTAPNVLGDIESKKHGYDAAFAAAPYADKVECQDVVISTLSQAQQMALLSAASDPHKVVMALGRNPNKLAELSEITNIVQFGIAIDKLEGKIQVKPRRISPAPEKIASGTGAIAAGGVNKTLAKLEAEADASGDRSKLVAYRYAQRSRK